MYMCMCMCMCMYCNTQQLKSPTQLESCSTTTKNNHRPLQACSSSILATMPPTRRSHFVAAACAALLSSGPWLIAMRVAHSTVEDEVANGWPVEANTTPATLGDDARSRYALSPDSTYSSETSSDGQWRGIVPGVATETPDDGQTHDPRSPWAVFTTTQLLSQEECAGWVSRAEEMELEDGDFIFATGEAGQLKRLT